jgi:uncharacterized protein (DUF2147 family)
MTLQGDTAVIGAPRDSTAAGEWAGSAYVYARSGGTWSLQATLLPPNQAGIDNFGRSVDLDGDTLVVGAPRVAVGEKQDAGAAYVFVRSGATWTLQATLTHPGPEAVDGFGRWAALSGDTIAASAPLDDTSGGVDAGSVFVFGRSGTTWSLQATLTSPTPRAGNRFGKALDLEGQTMLIGEPQSPGSGGAAKVGSAHVFVGSGPSWSLQETLIHPSRKADDHFGRWVSVSGDTTLVSAPSDDTSAGTNAGTAHVFVRSGTDWSFQSTLLPPDHRAGDNFGLRAILVGDTAVVGAPKDDTGAGDSAGRAFVFVRSGATWSVQATLLSPTPKATDLFGRGFGLDGTTLFVAEPYDDNATGKNAGAAHVFGSVSSTWSPSQTIIDPNTTPP